MQCLTPAARILPVNGDIESDFPHQLSKFRRSSVLHFMSAFKPSPCESEPFPRLTRGSLLVLRIRGTCRGPSPSVAPKGAGSIQPSLIASFRKTWLGNSHGTDVFEAEDIRRSSQCWHITPKVREGPELLTPDLHPQYPNQALPKGSWDLLPPFRIRRQSGHDAHIRASQCTIVLSTTTQLGLGSFDRMHQIGRLSSTAG
jgi:hypothetical protein